MRKKIVSGNWKMNLTVEESIALAKNLQQKISSKTDFLNNPSFQIIIAPTHLALSKVIDSLKDSPIKVAAQNVSYQDNGAYTGEVSVSMLKALNIEYCIIGHSERRAYFHESNQIINLKLKKLLLAKITPIFCIGETLEEREENRWQEVITQQLEEGLANLDKINEVVIAYEPVWAIGTGVSASEEQAQEVHAFIRSTLEKIISKGSTMQNPSHRVSEEITILYGGSVNAKNATNLFAKPDIDGGLVGGAALKVDDFYSIIQSNFNLS